jgi:hypothetical protein
MTPQIRAEAYQEWLNQPLFNSHYIKIHQLGMATTILVFLKKLAMGTIKKSLVWMIT